ncbi:hypothetical protein FB45DRAFT_733113 [Roridomyces roridus]|uniref:Pentatricopeptide repeat-containing protein-mitochondrial domain-containing protein n=1 Tax=Roridomyces roridus TaxID=1738132 RepID=A0AAD7CFD0_9AGAR|nr:hypothetical protein FB45DRAFT_733113 [Roridomyces roridus]
MAAAADKSQFPTCFTVAAEMKVRGVAPNLVTYNTLLRALAHGGYALPTFAVLEDMLSMGISPDTTSFNHIIDAHRTETSGILPFIMRRMEELGVPPNQTTYTLLITRFADDKNLEMALQYLHAMKNHNLVPEVAAGQAVILLAANEGYPKLALDLVTFFEEKTVRKVEDSIWLACLYSSAQALYGQGVIKCWYAVVSDLAIPPDEGLCTLVLHTAARNGLPDIATDVLRVLKAMDIPREEHHFASLFEACCRAANFEMAFTTLNVMRQNGVPSTLKTVLPLVRVVQQKPELLDQLWECLDKMQAEGQLVDVTSFNAVLHSSILTQPMSRALADYNTLESRGLAQNAESFAVFLDGCISAGNVAFGELALRRLKESETPVDNNSLEKMISLHLTQEVYDDAFVFLEEMESAGFTPSRQIYEAIIIKCAAAGDSRYLVALNEMQRTWKHVSPNLKAHAIRLYEEKQGAVSSTMVGMDRRARRFIETGGL